jgi:hypothetical protein
VNNASSIFRPASGLINQDVRLLIGMCGRSWLPVADPAARLTEIVRPALACLVGAHNVQIRGGDRSDQTRVPVDQSGGARHRAAAGRRDRGAA